MREVVAEFLESEARQRAAWTQRALDALKREDLGEALRLMNELFLRAERVVPTPCFDVHSDSRVMSYERHSFSNPQLVVATYRGKKLTSVFVRTPLGWEAS